MIRCNMRSVTQRLPFSAPSNHQPDHSLYHKCTWRKKSDPCYSQESLSYEVITYVNGVRSVTYQSIHIWLFVRYHLVAPVGCHFQTLTLTLVDTKLSSSMWNLDHGFKFE